MHNENKHEPVDEEADIVFEAALVMVEAVVGRVAVEERVVSEVAVVRAVKEAVVVVIEVFVWSRMSDKGIVTTETVRVKVCVLPEVVVVSAGDCTLIQAMTSS